MAKDYIGYQALTDAALRGVVRDALRRVEKQGLIANHHFRVTFKTQFAGVEIPDFLREQYPEEMTIILQHQFWDLTVNEQAFEVGLSFGGITERLNVPFEAINGFFDPSVQFGLQFDPQEAASEAPASANLPAVAPAPGLPAAAPVAENNEEPPRGNEGATVVRIDRFRKK